MYLLPIDHLYTNSELNKTYSELEMHVETEKGGFRKCEIKTLKLFSSDYNTLCEELV